MSHEINYELKVQTYILNDVPNSKNEHIDRIRKIHAMTNKEYHIGKTINKVQIIVCDQCNNLY